MLDMLLEGETFQILTCTSRRNSSSQHQDMIISYNAGRRRGGGLAPGRAHWGPGPAQNSGKMENGASTAVHTSFNLQEGTYKVFTDFRRNVM
jgi:hypothetical protein